MWFGEPHPFPERVPPTRLSNFGIIKLKRMFRYSVFVCVCVCVCVWDCLFIGFVNDTICDCECLQCCVLQQALQQ